MPVRQYSNTAVLTKLLAGVTAAATTIEVESTLGFPTAFPYTLVLGVETASEEIVTVTAAAGNVLTVTRGQDGTTGVYHATGARVQHRATARDLAEPQAHLVNGTMHVSVFADAAARTAAIPSPTEGMFTWLQDANRSEIHDGSAWRSLMPRPLVVARATTPQAIPTGTGTT